MSAPTTKSSALHTMSWGRRRTLVLTMQLGMAAYAIAFAFRGAELSWVLVLSVCSQLLYAVIFFRVLRPVMSEIIKKAPDLDERELSLRNQAHYSAYQVLVIVVTTVISAPMAASLYFGLELPLRVTEFHLLALFFLFANLSISLPASVVAWTEPDPEPEGF